MDIREEEKLVRAAQKVKSGPNQPFGELYQTHVLKIKNYFLSRADNLQLAEDMTSKTFEKALGGLDSFRWQGVPFSAWLFTIARNVFFDHLRSSKRKKEMRLNESFPIKEHSPTHLEQLEDIQQKEWLERALLDLPDREREIVYLKFYEGLTNRAIAKVTKLSETNVGTILYRTLKKLRNELAPSTDLKG